MHNPIQVLDSTWLVDITTQLCYGSSRYVSLHNHHVYIKRYVYTEQLSAMSNTTHYNKIDVSLIEIQRTT